VIPQCTAAGFFPDHQSQISQNQQSSLQMRNGMDAYRRIGKNSGLIVD
jgi:hypothetical protein